MKILVINAGSSSLKYQLIDMTDESVLAKGNAERIGVGGKITHRTGDGRKFSYEIELKNHTAAFKEVQKVLTTGEGASHAWVEVFDGETWIGVDPTHQRFCDDNYVKISQGPDFSFCALERGVFMGAADQSMSAKCKLVEI